jgi:hypothetical protein
MTRATLVVPCRARPYAEDSSRLEAKGNRSPRQTSTVLRYKFPTFAAPLKLTDFHRLRGVTMIRSHEDFTLAFAL